MEENGIRQIVVPIPANKEIVCMDAQTMMKALGVVLDRENYPLLIHCNKGKVRALLDISAPSGKGDANAPSSIEPAALSHVFARFKESLLLRVCRNTRPTQVARPGRSMSSSSPNSMSALYYGWPARMESLQKMRLQSTPPSCPH